MTSTKGNFSVSLAIGAGNSPVTKASDLRCRRDHYEVTVMQNVAMRHFCTIYYLQVTSFRYKHCTQSHLHPNIHLLLFIKMVASFEPKLSEMHSNYREKIVSIWIYFTLGDVYCSSGQNYPNIVFVCNGRNACKTQWLSTKPRQHVSRVVHTRTVHRPCHSYELLCGRSQSASFLWE